MDLRLRSRVRRHARLIGGVVGAAVLLTGGGTLAATSQQQQLPSGITMDQAEAFVGVTPTRVLDTRQIGSSKFNPGETRTLSFASYVPSEATSVSLAIVSPTGATSLGYFTMWPSGQPRPETSVLNPAPPYDLATSVLLRLGAGHSVDVYNAFGQADLVVDVLGYFVPLSSVEGLGSGSGGSSFLVGSGAPSPTLGNDGDVYYDTVNKIFYGPKDNGDWGDGSSAVGPQGPQGAVGSAGPAGPAGPAGAAGAVGPVGPAGPAGPAGADGADGAVGPAGADGAAGPAGAAGSKILTGSGAPTAGTGVDGDMYVDTSTGDLYGPKTGGVWGPPTSLVGPEGPAGAAGAQGPAGAAGADGADGVDGATILSGAVPPTALDGDDGDMWFDTATKTLYGPKTAGAWGAGTNLTGAQGIQGPQGPAGTMGPGLQVWQDAGLITAVILGGTDVDFPDANVVSYGAGAPTYSNGDITITTAGTYRVTYTYETTLGLLVSMRLTLNGAPVASSVSGGALAVAAYNGQALVPAGVGDTISLQFFGVLGAATANHGSIMIEKVA